MITEPFPAGIEPTFKGSAHQAMIIVLNSIREPAHSVLTKIDDAGE
jgi:hypothetical protein